MDGEAAAVTGPSQPAKGGGNRLGHSALCWQGGWPARHNGSTGTLLTNYSVSKHVQDNEMSFGRLPRKKNKGLKIRKSTNKSHVGISISY